MEPARWAEVRAPDGEWVLAAADMDGAVVMDSGADWDSGAGDLFLQKMK